MLKQQIIAEEWEEISFCRLKLSPSSRLIMLASGLAQYDHKHFTNQLIKLLFILLAASIWSVTREISTTRKSLEMTVKKKKKKDKTNQFYEENYDLNTASFLFLLFFPQWYLQ